jgi:Curlin associated repeat
MRIATGCMMFLSLAASPAFASEAFVAQVTHSIAATEATAASDVNAATASTLAAPLQPGAVPSVASFAPATVSNASYVMQSGTDNVATVAQTAGSNLSAVIQHGLGNQATVTQRQGGH